MAAYTVRFKCSNCSFVFSKVLIRGDPALGFAGECPTCGCTQDTVGKSGQKIGVFQIVPEEQIVNTLQLLLEEFGVVKPKTTERSKT